MSSFRSIQVVNVRWFNATAWYGLELARLLNAAGHESARALPMETFAKAEEMGLRPLAMPLNAKNPLEFPDSSVTWGVLSAHSGPMWLTATGENPFVLGLLKGMGGYALVRTRGSAAPREPPQPNFTYAGG
ncbi:MAG: hypothetical protein ACLT2T_01570 [Bilophila wadsworthia]